MKKYFIKIDVNSIKKNKNAGNTITKLPGKKNIYFECNYLPDFLENNKACFIEDYSFNQLGEINYVKGEIFTDELLQKCLKDKNIQIDIEQSYITYEHLPIPLYSFDYKNTKLRCYYCKKYIMLNDLKSDEIWDGQNEYYSDKICPKCGQFDCVDLEYEKIENVLEMNI